jgi:hypothetical protein
MAHNKRCPSLHRKCYPRQNARAFSAAIVAEVRLNISGSARRERGPKSQRWHDSIQTGSVPLASGADQISSARGRGPADRQGGPPGAGDLSLEALNSLFAREGSEEITTTTIDVTRTFSDFDDFWRAQTPIFNPITGMITALPESDRVRLIGAVQSGVPVGPGAASLIQQRECYQGRRE